MIDFKNKSLIKLKEINIKDGVKIVENILIEKEEVIMAFSSMRDKLVFTTKRIVSVNVQGLTGTKTDYTSIPYSKIQTYSIETAGLLDLDAELDLVISGLGTIRFELKGETSIKDVCRIISEKILN